jgi:aminotransferase EvaB
MTGYQYLGYKKGELPNTEKASEEIFSLPLYPTLNSEELKIVVGALGEIL